MKTKRSTLGFMVIEKCEDYEQPLGLIENATVLPEGGILTWTDAPRAVFLSRKDARDTITRTDHYGKAFGPGKHPEAKFCKIVRVETICRIAAH